MTPGRRAVPAAAGAVVQGLPAEDLESRATATAPSPSPEVHAPLEPSRVGPQPGAPTTAAGANPPHPLRPALAASSPYNANATTTSGRCFDPEADAPQRATVVRLVSLVDQHLSENDARSPGERVRSSPGMDAIVLWSVRLVKEPKEVADEARRVADAAGFDNRGPASVSVRCDGSICAINVRPAGGSDLGTGATPDRDSGPVAAVATVEQAARTIAQALLAIRDYQQPSIRDALVKRLLLIADCKPDPAGVHLRSGDRLASTPAIEGRDALERQARERVAKRRDDRAAQLAKAAAPRASDTHAADDSLSSDSSDDAYVVVTVAEHSAVATDDILDVYAKLLDACAAAELPLPHAVPFMYGALQLTWNVDLLAKADITWLGGLRNVCQLSRSGTLVLWDGTEIDCTEDCEMAVAALDLGIRGVRTASYVPRRVAEAVRSARASS